MEQVRLSQVQQQIESQLAATVQTINNTRNSIYRPHKASYTIIALQIYTLSSHWGRLSI